jgi:hypothetical protein
MTPSKVKLVAEHMVHACNPSYSGGRDQEDFNLRLAHTNSYQDPISTNKKLAAVVCTCHPSYTESLNRRITIQTDLA